VCHAIVAVPSSNVLGLLQNERTLDDNPGLAAWLTPSASQQLSASPGDVGENGSPRPTCAAMSVTGACASKGSP
jgi:hypothetical protein